MLRPFDKLPAPLRKEEIRPYYESLAHKRGQLLIKRCLGWVIALILCVVLSPFLLIIALAIKLDSPGPVLYKQERVTQYGRHFHIYKFRTMVANADKIGAAVTKSDDSRITRVGHFLRRLHLDEFSQLLNVLKGDMTFVGVRPEVPKFVAQYTPEMWATLLLPAGLSSRCSIAYRNENDKLEGVEDPEKVYVEEILPDKMRINLAEMKRFSLLRDIKTLWDTILCAFY